MPRQRQRHKADLTRQRLKSRLLRLPKRARLQEMASQLNSEDPMTRREIADVFKSVLGKGGGVQIDEIIELGVIPRFVEFLQCHDDPILQIEASMILNSIVTSEKSEHTEAVVEAGALPHLVQLLRSTNETANLQAAWVLNNIASESVVYRDRVVVEDGLSALLVSMQEIPFPEAGQLALKTQLSALLSFCGDRLGDRSKLPADVIRPALQVLRKILESYDPKADDEVLCMVCSVISCISKDGEDDSIGQIVDACLCSLLVELLRHRNPRVQAASVRALGNLVSGDDERHTQAVLDCAVLPQLLLVLQNQNHMWETRSDICWMLSNIAVGSLEQIQQLIESNLIPTLVKLLEDQTDHIDVRTEAAWVVSNSAASGSRIQIKYLVSQRCIHVLCHLLVLSEDSDLEMVNGVLHALENILEAGAAEAAQQMTMLRDEVETAMEKAEVFTTGPDGQLELPAMGPDFQHLTVKEGLTALTEQEEIAKMFPIATTLLNGKNRLRGAPAATSALEHVQNPYAVVLEQVSGVNHIAQFLALSDEYTVVESARRILENHFGMKKSAAEVSLHIASQEGDVEAASKLISYGAELEARDNTGRTGLIIAASLGHLELVRVLVEAGADMNASDSAHQTPIKLSANGGFKEVARYLIEALKEREVSKKVKVELERQQKEESEKRERADVIESVVECLESWVGDWDRLQQAVDRCRTASIGSSQVPVNLASRLLTCRGLMLNGLGERDRSRLQNGVEEAKRISTSLRGGACTSTDGWLGQLCEQANVMLGWLQEEKDAVGDLKACINQRNAGMVHAAIQRASTLLDKLREQGEESELLAEEIGSAAKVHERLLREEEAAGQLQHAMEAQPVQWSELEAAIRNAERFGLRRQVEEGRKVLKRFIHDARQEIQAAIGSRDAQSLRETIDKVQLLGIESLNGELESARKIASTVDKETNLLEQFEDTYAALGKHSALDLSQEEWDGYVSAMEGWAEEMRTLNMREQCKQARSALSTIRPQHQLHKMLLSSLSNPKELHGAIEKARANKSLAAPIKALLEQAGALLDSELDKWVTRIKTATAQLEDPGVAVEALMDQVKAAGMQKPLLARPGVRDSIAKAKEAQAAIARTQLELKQQLAASAEQALKQREATPPRERGDSADKPFTAMTTDDGGAAGESVEQEPPAAQLLETLGADSHERHCLKKTELGPTLVDPKPQKPQAPAKRAHKQAKRQFDMEPRVEQQAREQVGVPRLNGSAEEHITVSYHDAGSQEEISRMLGAQQPRESSRLDPKPALGSSSYAQVAGIRSLNQQSRFVQTTGSSSPEESSGEMGSSMAPPWQLPDPSAATPSSWVQACATTQQGERDNVDMLKTSDSPSEDAFIQSIFRELDLDDDDDD
eukprot:TRINITY_DN19783_c0_g2_i1.p1 TRINITY_DN19783_c0_g2~~TRINITY_DN19783_c0_g2_i1.p1  ORF type:complete len:1381 (+),score=466.60 TRINITY_DN19783_c0_g2_i1:101-4243(+)